ncbi:MAG: hypothetical protein IJ509_01945 [Bacilli bacterium]|nr:hypothetical protein [Bacilli bacterium]
MVETKYTNHGINKNTYDLIFNEKEKNIRECSKEILTIEENFKHPKDLRDALFLG